MVRESKQKQQIGKEMTQFSLATDEQREFCSVRVHNIQMTMTKVEKRGEKQDGQKGE